MTNPNFVTTPWPQIPATHPEAPAEVANMERRMTPDDLRQATWLTRGLLNQYADEAPWQDMKTSGGAKFRRRTLPLTIDTHGSIKQNGLPNDLDGTVKLTETERLGHVFLDVVKDQLGENTTWRWDETGRGQTWRRKFLSLKPLQAGQAPPDEELIITDSTGNFFTQIVLSRLEDTLTLLHTLPETARDNFDNIYPRDFLTPEEESIMAASYDPLMEGFIRAVLATSDTIEPDDIERVLEQVKAEYKTLSDEQINDAYRRCLERVHLENERKEKQRSDYDSRPPSRRQLIEQAANHPSVTMLISDYHSGLLSDHEFVMRLYLVVDQLCVEFDLSTEELGIVLDLVNPATGDEGAGYDQA